MADSISKLTNFTEQQVAFNTMFSSKLECLIRLTERIQHRESKTEILKSCLVKEIEALKSGSDLGKPNKGNDVLGPTR